MTSLSEQLSAVRQSQWEAQLDMFRTLSSRALDNAEQLIALNMKTSRASMEQAAGTFKQMLDARDPRDLLAVGAAAQQQWQQMFSYGSELLGIATGMRVRTWSTQPMNLLAAPLQLLPAGSANVPSSVPQALEQAAIATADATTVASEIAAAAADTGNALAQATLHAGSQAAAEATRAAAPAGQPAASEPVPPVPEVTELEAEKTGAAPSETPDQGKDESAPAGTRQASAPAAPAAIDIALETAISDDVPPAKAKPLASALNEIAPKPASAEHPIASTVPLEAANGHVEMPAIAPIDTPLDAPADSAAAPQAPARDAKPTRASRKK